MSSVGDVVDLLGRVGPVVVFLLTITVTAELADRAGVFDVAGHRLARLGRHRLWLLWLLYAALATACTIVLSLDTTAVLLTPVGLAVARQIGAPPLPFALTTLWLANTGSLLLPVSNLTNLLALHRLESLGVDHGGYVRLMAAPALAAVLATVVAIGVLQRRRLAGRYVVEPPPEPHEPRLLVIMGAVCLLVGAAFAVGVEPAVAAVVAAVVSLAATALLSPASLRAVRPPWLMAAGFVLVAVLVAWLGDLGLTDWWREVLPGGRGTGALLGIAAGGAALANLANNLPAYLSIEPAVSGDPLRLAALLIGVNVGPLVTPWASLATLLWLDRCRAAGVRINPWKLAAAGLVCAVAAVVAATVVL